MPDTVHTSDGEARPNVQPSPQLTTPGFPYHTIDDGSRMSVLIVLGNAINGLASIPGTGTRPLPVPSQSASWNVGTDVKYLRPYCAAMALPVPTDNIDYSAFTSICNALATAIG